MYVGGGGGGGGGGRDVIWMFDFSQATTSSIFFSELSADIALHFQLLSYQRQ